MTKLALALALTAAVLPAQPAARNIKFNGRTLNPAQMAQLEALERRFNVRLPNAEFWYDPRSGAAGFWNGPAVAALPPELDLGGPMPANCSGGGTNVFVNGRELHPVDVQGLMALGPVYPGRYWADANGNIGLQLPQGDSPALLNLFVLARQAQSRGQQHRVYAPGELSGLTVFNSAGACTDSGNCFYTGH